MALTKFSQETHKTTTHNGQDSASAVRGWSFATKQYTRDKDDGEEDAFSGCIWRGMTTSSRTQTVFHDCCKTYHVVVILCARANLPRRLFEGGVISLSASNCAAFIRGRRQFAEIRYYATVLEP